MKPIQAFKFCYFASGFMLLNVLFRVNKLGPTLSKLTILALCIGVLIVVNFHRIYLRRQGVQENGSYEV